MQLTRLLTAPMLLATPLSTTLRLSGGGPTASALATDQSKALHALGYNIGGQMGDLRGFDAQGVDDILSGIRAALLEQPPEVKMEEFMPKAAQMMQARQQAMSQEMAQAGAQALASAANEPGAQRTASGLVILIEREGSGNAPTAAQTVEVHYEGSLVDGTIFDSSYARGEPISFPLNGVIKGWTEGLQMMKPGGKAKLTIPSDLAYGDAGTGPIPAKAVLVFDVELLAVNP